MPVDQEGPANSVSVDDASRRQSMAHAEPVPVQRNPLGRPAYPVVLGTVLVADRRPATRMRLSDALRDIGFIHVLEADGIAALDTMIADEPAGQLALISLEFGPAADRVIGDLLQVGWPRVLVTVPFNDAGPVIRAIGAGASGFLRGAPARPSAPHEPVGDYRLSEREIELIRLVADGRSNRAIGQRLGISMLTVKNHLARISRKFGTGDRAQIVARAMRAGTIR